MYICTIATLVLVMSSAVSADHRTVSTQDINGDTTELPTLEELVYQIKNQLENVTNEKADLEERLTQLEQKYVPQSAVNTASRTTFPNVIGFTAQVDNTINDLPVGSTVIYDGIWYNAGSGYDITTGVFTCPKSGVYLFAIFAQSYSSDPINIHLAIDGSKRTSAMSQGVEDGHDSTGANILVEHIAKGQRVWVETQQYDNQDIFSWFSTFSGVLIQAT